MDTAYTGTIHLNGASGADTFDLHDLGGYTGTITIAGNGGADTYQLGDHFGQVSITGTAADTLDFTNNTGTISYDGSAFTDTTGDSATTSGMANGHIDVSFAGGVGNTIKSDVASMLESVKSAVTTVDAAGNALSTLLPLLNPASGGSIDKLISVVESVGTFADNVNSTLVSHTKLSVFATQLNSIISSLPDLASGVANPLKGLHFDTGFGSNGSDLLVYLTATLTPSTASCDPSGSAIIAGNGQGCITTLIPLAFGTRLDGIGISLDADPNQPGVQPPNFKAQATIAASFAVGEDFTSLGTPFLKDGGHLDLNIDASLNAATLSISLGLLSASISSGTIDLNGSVQLLLTDPSTGDNGVTATDLTNGALHVPTPTATISSPITLTVSIDPGLTIGDTSTSLASATLKISFGSDFTPQSVPLFGDGINAPQPNVDFTTSDGAGATLLNSFSSGFTSTFSNAGPNEIISMISQVASFFGSIAGQSFLGQQIPFTSLTLGQLLDYAKGFKHDYLDPLFKSGDSTKPDANGDGKVDVNDFNFSSIQGLLNRLTAALGLGTALKAEYHPSDGTLTFPFNFDQTFGIGTGVDVAPTGAVAVTSAPLGGGGVFTLATSTAGHYTITFNGATTTDIAFNADKGTVSGLLTLPSGAVFTCENGAVELSRRSVQGHLQRRLGGDHLAERGGAGRHRRERRHVLDLERNEGRRRNRLERQPRHLPDRRRHGARRRRCDRRLRQRRGQLQRRSVPDRLQRQLGRRNRCDDARARQLQPHEREQPRPGADHSGRDGKLLGGVSERIERARAHEQAEPDHRRSRAVDGAGRPLGSVRPCLFRHRGGR